MNHFIACLFLFLNMNLLFAADINSLPDLSKLSNPFEGQNNVYAQIFDELNSEYQHIGQRQAQNILQNNSLSVIGGLNSVGLNYNRPFGNFSISLDRSLAPDLFDNTRWIVTDTFSINIDASKVMSNLQNQGVINLDAKVMAAFAGIVFKRTFKWVHFASSYDEGLSTHFEKLFFPFHALTFENMTSLGTNEIITKEDSLSLSAGGFVSVPLYTGVAAMGGVLGKFQKLSHFEAAAMEGNHLQLSLETSTITSAGFSVSVEGLFLKVIKLTLLSYDFEYENQSSYTIYTDFKDSELLEMSPENPVALEINQLLRNKAPDLTILAPYISSEEKQTAQKIASNYSFLFFGGNRTSQTQQIEVTKDGVVKTFFKHSYAKVKYTESLLSELFSGLISGLTNSSVASTKLSSETKSVEIEYDSQKNLLEAHEDLDLGVTPDSQKLSMHFTGEFMTKKTIGSSGKKYRDRAIFNLEKYTGVDPLIPQMIDREYLKAPLLIQGNYQVNTDGIRYFNALNAGQVFDTFSALCDDQPKTSFFNFRNLFDNCRRSLQNDYLSYLIDLSHNQVTSDIVNQCEKTAKHHLFWSSAKKRAYIKNCLGQTTFKDAGSWTIIPLWPLKNLSQNIVNNANNKLHFYNLFGVQNVFFYGSVDAVTADGRAFTSAFHEGAFKGFGTVDNYMRQENLRSPASVVVDQ